MSHPHFQLLALLTVATLVTAGCAAPEQNVGDDANLLRVYVENSGRDNLTFRVTVNGNATQNVTVPTGAPSVRIAYEENLTADNVTVAVDELSKGLHLNRTVDLTRDAYVIANVVANGTMDIVVTHEEPLFD